MVTILPIVLLNYINYQTSICMNLNMQISIIIIINANSLLNNGWSIFI